MRPAPAQSLRRSFACAPPTPPAPFPAWPRGVGGPVAFALAGLALGGSLLGACSRRAESGVLSASASRPSSGGASAGRAALPAPAGASEGSSRALELWSVDRVRAEMRHRRGQPLVVHMWASWCGPCLEELPAIDAFAQKARAHGISVLSLALDTDYRSGGSVPAALNDRAPHLTRVIARFDDAAPFMALFSKQWEGTIPALFAFDSAGTLQESLVDGINPARLDRLITTLTATKP